MLVVLFPHGLIHRALLRVSCRHSPKSGWYLRLCCALSDPVDIPGRMRWAHRSLWLAYDDGDKVRLGTLHNKAMSRSAAGLRVR